MLQVIRGDATAGYSSYAAVSLISELELFLQLCNLQQDNSVVKSKPFLFVELILHHGVQ